MVRQVKPLLERWPRLYLEILRLKRWGHWSRPWVVSKSSELVIEGFPRSANSFARAAFVEAQTRPLRMATHVHSSAQVVQAVRWRIPTLVLLREPDGAVRGDIAFACELRGRDPETVSAGEMSGSLRRYVRFYESIFACRHGFLVGEFAEVTTNFSEVMRRFNARFGTDYAVFDHTRETASAIMTKSMHIGPQPARERIKAAVEAGYESFADSDLRSRAWAIYRRLTESPNDEAYTSWRS